MINSVHSSYRTQQTLLAGFLCLLISFGWNQFPHPVIVIIIGLVPISLLLVLRFPFLMVLLFTIFSFFRIHEVIPQLYNFKLPLLFSLASMTALSWHIAISHKIKPYWNHQLTLLSLFFLLVTIGILFSSNRPIAIEYFKGIYWKIGLMTLAISWLTRKSKDFSLSSVLIVLCGFLVGLVALFNKINSIGLVEGTRVTIGRNIGSMLGDPNDLALVLMFPAAFAVSLLMSKNQGKLLFSLGLVTVPILFAAIIATQSRGGLLGIMAVFAVYAWRRIHSKTVFMVLAFIAIIGLYVVAGIDDRASGGTAEQGLDASAQGRLYAWQAAFGMALDNPLTGVGLDNFYSNYYFYSSHWDGLNHAVHSTWFGVLAETGFLGLIIFIALIITLLRSAFNSLYKIEAQLNQVPAALHATSMATLTGLIGTVVSGTFLTQGFNWPIYILSGFVIAVDHWVKQHLPENHKGTDKTRFNME